MKKLMTILTACFFAFAAMGQQLQVPAKWQKMTDPVWIGKTEGVTHWYKVEGGKLVASTDNVKWEASQKGTWTDVDGNVYRIDNANILMSKDHGNTWDNFASRTWRGSDGTWYMFDDQMLLWSGGSGNEPPTEKSAK